MTGEDSSGADDLAPGSDVVEDGLLRVIGVDEDGVDGDPLAAELGGGGEAGHPVRCNHVGYIVALEVAEEATEEVVSGSVGEAGLEVFPVRAGVVPDVDGVEVGSGRTIGLTANARHSAGEVGGGEAFPGTDLDDCGGLGGEPFVKVGVGEPRVASVEFRVVNRSQFGGDVTRFAVGERLVRWRFESMLGDRAISTGATLSDFDLGSGNRGDSDTVRQVEAWHF